MSEQVEPDTFEPWSHKLKPLTEMMIDMGTSEPVLQKPYPIAMKHFQC